MKVLLNLKKKSYKYVIDQVLRIIFSNLQVLALRFVFLQFKEYRILRHCCSRSYANANLLNWLDTAGLSYSIILQLLYQENCDR